MLAISPEALQEFHLCALVQNELKSLTSKSGSNQLNVLSKISQINNFPQDIVNCQFTIFLLATKFSHKLIENRYFRLSYRFLNSHFD